MKIYIDFTKQMITKLEFGNTFKGDISSNCFEVLFSNIPLTAGTWFPTMSQLAPNGRQAGDFSPDPLDEGETNTFVENGVTYQKFNFTMNSFWANVTGISNFFIWINKLVPMPYRKCVGKVIMDCKASTDGPFVADVKYNPYVKEYIDITLATYLNGQPQKFDTTANMENYDENVGLILATDTGKLWYWNESITAYVNSNYIYIQNASNVVYRDGKDLKDSNNNTFYPTSLIPVTYDQLKALKTSSNLEKGMYYRITDYCTYVNGLVNNVVDQAKTAHHHFDIIVLAIESNQLSEDAFAIQHSGDTYFNNSNLNSWKLKYCFENDTTRFEWAPLDTMVLKVATGDDENPFWYYKRYPAGDITGYYCWGYLVDQEEHAFEEIRDINDPSEYFLDVNDVVFTTVDYNPTVCAMGASDGEQYEILECYNGKGVIYRMIDEFGNDLPYDFKNIMFKRYKITAVGTGVNNTFVNKYYGTQGQYRVTNINNEDDYNNYKFYYTFSRNSNDADLSLTQITASSLNASYYVKQVVLGQYLTDNPYYRCKQALNNNVFIVRNIIVDVKMGDGNHHNTFIGNIDIDYCYFGAMCRNNLIYGEIMHVDTYECFQENTISSGVISNNSLRWFQSVDHFSRTVANGIETTFFNKQATDNRLGFVSNCQFFGKVKNLDVENNNVSFTNCEFNEINGFYIKVTNVQYRNNKFDFISSVTSYVQICYSNIGPLLSCTLSKGEESSISLYNLTTSFLNGLNTVNFGNLKSVTGTNILDSLNICKRLDVIKNTSSSISGQTCLALTVYEVENGVVEPKVYLSQYNQSNATWILADKTTDVTLSKVNPTGTGEFSFNNTSSHSLGDNSFTFGNNNVEGDYCGAFGNDNWVGNWYSYALGRGLKSNGDYQLVFGRYNLYDETSIEIVGNGTDDTHRNVIRLLDQSGNQYIAGDLFFDSTFSDNDTEIGIKDGTSLKGTLPRNIELAIDSTNYKITAKLKNAAGTVIATSNAIDLPLESVVVSGSYDSTNKNVVLTLENGSTIEFSVVDLISGLQSEITAQNKLSSDYVDDTNNTHKFVSLSDISNWNGKQDTISGSTSIDITSNTISVKDSYITGQFLTDAEMTTLLGEVF